MTKGELIQRIRVQLANDAYYIDTDISDSISDGFDEIVAFSGVNLKSASIPFINGLTYYDLAAKLPGFLAIYALFNRTTKRWMYPASILRFDNDRLDWETATGTPDYFVPISCRYMAIYKKPVVDNYGDMWCWYVAQADSVDAETALLPDTIRAELIESYVFTDLYEQNQEWTKAGGKFNDYEALLKDLRVWVQSERIPDRLLQLNPRTI